MLLDEGAAYSSMPWYITLFKAVPAWEYWRSPRDPRLFQTEN